MEKPLSIFFAVTKTSLYKVEIIAQIFPTLTKLAGREKSDVRVGEVINDGTMLAIARKLILYSPDETDNPSEHRIEYVNPRFWGGRTSDIVALFFEKSDAEECFKSEYRGVCDIHFFKETKKVLDAIGDDHPVFKICHIPGGELIPNFKI